MEKPRNLVSVADLGRAPIMTTRSQVAEES